MTSFGPKNILCPVDLSPVSDGILKWAGLFARAFEAPLEVLHADWWEPPRYFTEAQIQWLSRQELEGEKVIRRELEAQAKAALGVFAPCNITMVKGYPSEQILQRAKELKAGLIVMGSHGRTGMARLRLGSVAEDVVREARCPVLIVKPSNENGPPPAIQNILCPVNFTSLAQQSMEISSELARAFRARLWIVHAAGHEEVNVDEIKQRICDWVPKEVRGRCEVSEVVRRGNPAEQILLMARERSADLIVMGAQHRPFLEFTTLGTTAERVMRHSPSSVMVIPATKTGSSE